MRDPLRADVALIAAHIDSLKRAHPDLVEDADLLAGTIEGETDFDRVLEAIVEAKLDADSMAEAGRIRRNKLSDRIKRYEAMGERMQALVFDLMKAADKKTHRIPVATISVRPGAQSVFVEDEAEVAKLQGFTKTETVIKRDEIRKALMAGEPVPGARLLTGPATLQIRTT